jgi:hypothetical protein
VEGHPVNTMKRHHPLKSIALLLCVVGTAPAQAKLFEYDQPPATWLGLVLPDGEAVGDVDGDGDLDFVYVVRNLQSVTQIKVARNDGTGNFTIGVAATSGKNEIYLSVELADLDKDKDLDLIVLRTVNYSGNDLVLYENSGNGAFAVSKRFSTPSLKPAWLDDFAVADLDLDGDMDLVTDYFFLWNDGSGKFTRRDPIPNRSVAIVPTITIADFNNDRLPDVFFGTGATKYTNDEIWVSDGKGGYKLWWSWTTVVGQSRAADLNGDGKVDLLAASAATNKSLFVLLNKGNGMTQVGSYPIVDTFDVGDFDGDGDIDVVSAGRILLNDGSGKLSDATKAVLQPPTWPSTQVWSHRARVADVDGDGDPDVGGLLRISSGGPPIYGALFIRNLRRQLRAPATAGLGGSLPVTLIADDKHQMILGISLREVRVPIGPWGDLRLDTTVFVALAPVTLNNRVPGGFTFPVPNDTRLRGLTLRFQALDVPPSPSTDIHFTSLGRTGIVK